MKYILNFFLLLLCGVAFYATYRYVLQSATGLPSNSPLLCEELNTSDSALFVALGDSITHGRVSADYLQLLADLYEPGSFVFINAGINSQLAYNVYKNLDSAIACQPSYVTLLVGTNDVNSTRSTQNAQSYIEKWQLPKTPDFEFYKENIKKIVGKLKSQTTARIAIFSLPPIGENSDSKVNNTVAQYNNFILQTANQNNLTYLPLNERMWQYLNAHDNLAKNCSATSNLMEKAIGRHYLLGQSWNDISKSNEFLLLTDCIHLNDTAAQIVADLAQKFLSSDAP